MSNDDPVLKTWIGVDLDGTLFEYHGWVNWNSFGKPIGPMLDRVKTWVREGRDVRIVTARIGLPDEVVGGKPVYRDYVNGNRECVATGERFSNKAMERAIQNHLMRHGLPPLGVQCYKDVHMLELWDDRAIQVIPNRGITLAEEHAAEYNAQRGKVFQGDAE